MIPKEIKYKFNNKSTILFKQAGSIYIPSIVTKNQNIPIWVCVGKDNIKEVCNILKKISNKNISPDLLRYVVGGACMIILKGGMV